MSGVRSGPRRFLSPHGQGGQIIVFYLVFIIPMAMLLFSVYNVGQLTSEKMKLQNAADNAAYSAAVWEARYLNLNGYINRAMVANYDTIAFFVSLWSLTDAFDGFIELVRIVAAIFGVDLSSVHKGVHKVNEVVSKIVGGSKQGQAVAYVFEKYTLVLSVAQQALYFLNQAGRISVIKSVAWGVDPTIQYSTFGEIFNALSLHGRVKWEGTNENHGLRQTVERSLNEWSRGESVRDTDNVVPFYLQPINLILKPFDIICFFGDVGLTIGTKGYNVQAFDHETGDAPGCDETGCVAAGKPTESIVRDDKLYQHDVAGIILSLCVVEITVGHHSDDAFNLGGSSMIDVGDSSVSVGIGTPHVLDEEDHVQFFTANGIQCSSFGGAIDIGSTIADAQEESCERGIGQTCGFGELPAGMLGLDGLDGGELRTACASRLSQNCENDSSQCLSSEETEQRLDKAEECGDIFSGVPQNIPGIGGGVPGGSGGTGGGPCQTIYEWDTKLKDMKVTTYVHDPDVEDGRRIEGPTVLVYFRKRPQFLPIFSGLYYPNPPTLEAYSFAKVYYTQRVGDVNDNPKRKESNKESVFNSFWAARLELPKPFGSDLLFH
jgi:hypothetical protein